MGQHQIGAGEIRDCALEQRIADDAVVGIFLYELLEVLFFLQNGILWQSVFWDGHEPGGHSDLCIGKLCPEILAQGIGTDLLVKNEYFLPAGRNAYLLLLHCLPECGGSRWIKAFIRGTKLFLQELCSCESDRGKNKIATGFAGCGNRFDRSIHAMAKNMFAAAFL